MYANLGQHVHPSWHIAALATGTLAGIALTATLGPFAAEPYWLLLAGALLITTFTKQTAIAIVLAVTAGLLFGMWRGSVEQVGLTKYSQFYNHTVTIRGIVSDDTTYGPHGDQRLTLKEISINGQKVNGQLWASALDSSTIKRSDRVTLSGKLGAGFGSMSASMFHADVRSVIRPNPGDVGLAIRDWFASGIRRAIPEPEAGLASGYLVGQRSTLPADLDNQLRTVGLTHAVVASGYNLTILVSLARQLLLGVSKYLATLSAAGMIFGFVALSGLSPSMTRAALVTGLSLAGWYYGRKFHPLVLLPLAAAITAVINPFYIWGDIGWYLSFTSFAGVIILAPLIERAFWKKSKPGFIAQLVVETMSAQIATLPIMIFAFGQYSPYALLANLLVLPLIPLTMLLTFIAGLLGVFVPPIAHLAGLPATYILRYMIAIVGRIADLPGAQGTLQLTPLMLAATYVAIGALVYLMWNRTRFNPRVDTLDTIEETS